MVQRSQGPTSGKESLNHPTIQRWELQEITCSSPTGSFLCIYIYIPPLSVAAVAGARGIQKVKFLKPNKMVIVLQGRFAGRKAVIIGQLDEGTRERPYGHCLVTGIYKYPSKIIRKDVNYNHIMPTRYTVDIDLKDVVPLDILQQGRDKKVAALKAGFVERFKTGKNKWFFPKLKF